ncbi:scavenger receptor class B member 1-like [Episyrphus balteatus]|uniref:scavenger receptor class B member 1-like n=1 Tax=Episyrphus balteatus TaxID=286459 RepID=UPI002486B2BD|nr:scavenger receptor class B member 1-like [Episyrphus balteatus]
MQNLKMLEMNFDNENCNYSNNIKTDPKEDMFAELLRKTSVEDDQQDKDEIDSNAKRKACSYLCYNINTYLQIFFGTLFIVLALLLSRWSLFEIITTTRLRMTPKLPPYELWAKPEPIIYCRVYLFTAVNGDAFLNGTDAKLKIKELGPIVFREQLEHNDIVRHENSTLSYTARRYLEFLPDMNEPGILDRHIIVPNIVLLGMVTKIADSLFTTKIPFNMISRADKLFVNMTVSDYFWNFTTPALLTVDKYLPFLVPVDNGGTLHMVYKDFNDRINVRIGPKYNAQEFFTINTFGYQKTVPGYQPERGDCYADLMNSTEGAIYPNQVAKDVILWYWRKSVCRPIPLYFEKEVQMGKLKAFKYVTHVDWYDRKENLTEDCYKGFGRTPLPDGLSDISKCYSGLPIAVSSPHFFGRSGIWDDKLEGFTPNYVDHGSYAIVEPVNGVPLDQKARSQSNLVLPKLSGFSQEVNKFSEMIVPIIWCEYHLPEVTPSITALLIFTSNYLPRLRYIVPVIFLILGLILIYFVIKRLNDDISLSGYSRVKLLWRREKNHYLRRSSNG